MSTKIYHGFKFRSGSLHQLQSFLMKWRETLKPLHRKELAEVYARIATNTLDKSFTNPDLQAGKTPWLEAFSNVIDRQKQIKKTGYRDPEVDFDFEVSILPHGRNIYGIIYTEQGKWRNLFLEQPEIEDFSYWNNSDRPETLTARIWNHRSKVWEAILGSHGIPALRGFYAQCTEETIHIDTDDILTAIQPHEVRVRNLSKDVVMGAEMHRRLQDLPEHERKSNLFETLFATERWLKSPEGNALLQAKITELQAILPKMITRDLLISKITVPDPTKTL